MTALQPLSKSTKIEAGVISMAEAQAEKLSEEQTSKILTIESRFGEVTINIEKAIFFPHGLLGISEAKDFCLTEIPGKTTQFKLLQCLNDYALSFVVLPLAIENGFIDKADMEECEQVTGVERQNMALLVTVTMVPSVEGGAKVTANLRAPIVIDTERKLAVQYIFTNNKYQVNHPLN